MNLCSGVHDKVHPLLSSTSNNSFSVPVFTTVTEENSFPFQTFIIFPSRSLMGNCPSSVKIIVSGATHKLDCLIVKPFFF
ncbi:092R [Invertebrate iridescent virus 6]|uniref:092R n=1 Tax=Invertebrate iridescent virus 6 TaxID=176652 RepID=Q91G22_IIV6|nr:092R [Invertebrate iridescent virus 6]AAK82010.1 092R [Invertebrate iridescent virus 6]QMS79506.1 hypothetical protein IIV6-T1_096 [Invertebrate iridescent virus 6]